MWVSGWLGGFGFWVLGGSGSGSGSGKVSLGGEGGEFEARALGWSVGWLVDLCVAVAVAVLGLGGGEGVEEYWNWRICVGFWGEGLI